MEEIKKIEVKIMNKNIIISALVTLFVVGTLTTLPVFAANPMNNPPVTYAGPNKANSDNIIKLVHSSEYTFAIKANNKGWQQWWYTPEGEVVQHCIVLYTEGMPQQAIDAKIAAGWWFHDGLAGNDVRYPVVGGGSFIYMYPIYKGP